MIVWLNAWPMCSVPVIWGGSWMQNAGLPAWGAPVPETCIIAAGFLTGPHWASSAAGLADLGQDCDSGCWTGLSMVCWVFLNNSAAPLGCCWPPGVADWHRGKLVILCDQVHRPDAGLSAPGRSPACVAEQPCTGLSGIDINAPSCQPR